MEYLARSERDNVIPLHARHECPAEDQPAAHDAAIEGLRKSLQRDGDDEIIDL